MGAASKLSPGVGVELPYILGGISEFPKLVLSHSVSHRISSGGRRVPLSQ